MKYKRNNILITIGILITSLFITSAVHAAGDPYITVHVTVDGKKTAGVEVCRAQEGAIDIGRHGDITPAEWCSLTGAGGSIQFRDDEHLHGNWGCNARNHMVYVKDDRVTCVPVFDTHCLSVLPGMANPRTDACYVGAPRLKGDDKYADIGSYYKYGNDGYNYNITIACTSLQPPSDIPPEDWLDDDTDNEPSTSDFPHSNDNGDDDNGDDTRACKQRTCTCPNDRIDPPCASDACDGGICNGTTCVSCEAPDPNVCVINQTLCSQNEHCGTGGICGYNGVCRSCGPLNCAPCP